MVYHPPPPPSQAHHQLARKALLCEGVALGQRAEEAAHALVLLQGGVALEGLLDQPPQLLWLPGVGWGGGANR